MPTKRTRTPSKKRAPTRRAPKRRNVTNATQGAADRDRPVPDNARRFAENIVRRMWPTLYVKAVEAAPSVTRALLTLT
jgi:hypothetical protein